MNKRTADRGQRTVTLLVLAAGVGLAATTQTWELSSYQDFLRGKLNGLSLTQDGRLVTGARIDTVFNSDQAEVWTVVPARDGSMFIGTGHRGRVYKIDAQGRSSLVWTSDQPEIFALAIDAKGVLYAGTSPDGKVYRVENGKAAEYFNPQARYIWAMQFAPDGALMVATGDSGRIFKVTAAGQGLAGQGTVFYETGQSHVTCLAFDRAGNLLAGSEPNGILYRIAPNGKAFVLHDANLPEIHALAVAPNGAVYAAALGGSVAKRTGSPGSQQPTAPLQGPSFSVTVTDAAQAGLNIPPKPDAAKAAASAAAQSGQVGQATTEYTGVERSAIYRINPDNTVETLWTSKEENAYDVALDGDAIVFATDSQARLYRLGSDRKTTLLAQTNEGEALRVVAMPAGLIAATGNLGKVLRLSSNGTATGGSYESPVHDAQTVARWGRITWRGEGSGISFRTRSGNSLRPDSTWSDWSPQISSLENSGITSPNARYIQWRAEFPASGSPALDDVTIAYLPQNTPPVVRSINVGIPGQSAAKAVAAGNSGATPSYSITVTDSGEAAPAAAGASAQTLSRAQGAQVQVSWQADDPDGDKLVYWLYFRGEEEREWKLLKAHISENTYLLDTDVFADGRYFFKVVASDRPSNPIGLARESELVSAPVLIDNTPPTVTAGAPRRSATMLEIDVDAVDRGNVLRRCEFSVDAGPWMPVEAVDGVTDSEHEKFLVRIESLPAGEHLVVIRVYDAGGNAGVTKVVVR